MRGEEDTEKREREGRRRTENARDRVRRGGTYREGRGRIEAMRERKSEKEDREKE